MLGRALEGDVERDFHAVLGGSVDQVPEVVQRAQFRMNRIVAAFGAANCVGHARITFDRHQRVVPPLALRCADRVDRSEIEDVEPHLRDAGQLPLDIGERGAPALFGSRRAREHRVPRGIAGRDPVDRHRQQRGSEWVPPRRDVRLATTSSTGPELSASTEAA